MHSNEELLEAWKEAWYDAGWEPLVLGLEEAKKHKNYERFIDAFNEADFEVRDYDRIYFLRWLAMAVVGGGWMSDYDTFPVYSHPLRDGFVLPNGGNFTCYSRHVPNIVSGSLEEWERLSDLLYFSYKMHEDEFWSDLLALHELRDINGYIYQTDSISLEKVYLEDLKYGELMTPICNEYLGLRAIHFSHSDCYSVGSCMYKRKMAYGWIQAWKDKCSSSEEN
jgi:hypothetical protein